MERDTTPSILATIALILAVVALVFAWVAYNRAGVNLENQVLRETEDAVESVGLEDVDEETEAALEQAAARADARADLETLQARLEVDQDYEAAAQELAEIQSNIEIAYDDVSVETRQELNEIQAGFDQAELALREGTADSLDYIGDIIQLLETDVRTDEG